MISSTGELRTRSTKRVKPARAEVRQIWLSLTRRGAVLWILHEFDGQLSWEVLGLRPSYLRCIIDWADCVYLCLESGRRGLGG